MKAYRITFAHSTEKSVLQPENRAKFNELFDKYHVVINHLLCYTKAYGIEYAWHFFEPHVEFTWLSETQMQSDAFIKKAREVLGGHGILDMKEHPPGNYGDWFCENEGEREFGAKRHSLCEEWIQWYLEHKEDVDRGKGVRKQVERTIHTLCNPLGLTYVDEAKICFSRGLICLLFRFFSFNKAVWIYTKIFRQGY